MFELFIAGLAAYLLGSVSGSMVAGVLFGGGDIRREGSGNAGATNALRTRGKSYALLVLLIDVGKGALAAAFIPGLAGASALDLERIQVFCAAMVVFGHIWPFWYDYRGGKGAATLVGAFLVLAPAAVPWFVLVWIIGIALTGYVGLCTILVAWFAPLWLATMGDASSTVVSFAVCMAVVVLYAHRDNVARLRAGTENRMTRAMLWRRP